MIKLAMPQVNHAMNRIRETERFSADDDEPPSGDFQRLTWITVRKPSPMGFLIPNHSSIS